MLKNVKKYIEKGIGLTFYKHLTNDDLNKYYENIAQLLQEITRSQ